MSTLNVNIVHRPILCLRGRDRFTLELEANSSTGRSWTRRDCCYPTIIRDSNRYIQHQGPPGTGGVDLWTFTAIERGQELVKLAYAPECDPSHVEKWVEIHFTVD